MEQKGGGRMKCQKCDGRGTVQEPIYNKSHTLIKNWKTVKCDVCGGCGEFDAFKPMTNEEYLRSLNTEQLADVFFDYRYANATPRQKLWMSASEECIKTDMVEWLKQQHTPKE